MSKRATGSRGPSKSGSKPSRRSGARASASTAKLPPDWREFCASLISRRVRFLIVGAHALAAHGRPRATDDLDVLIDPTKANTARLAAALDDFGFAAFAQRAGELASGERMATIGRPPLRIDVMNTITGVSFREA